MGVKQQDKEYGAAKKKTLSASLRATSSCPKPTVKDV